MTKTVVSDLMTREVLSIEPDTAIETAARLMSDRHVSGLPVVENGRPVGVVSLIDLVDPDRARSEGGGAAARASYYAMADGAFVSSAEATLQTDGVVRDIMTPYVISVEQNATLDAAARQMIEYKVHRLLVMEGEQLVGLVSSLDLLAGYAKSH